MCILRVRLVRRRDMTGQDGTRQNMTVGQCLVSHNMTGRDRTELVKMTNLPLVQKLQLTNQIDYQIHEPKRLPNSGTKIHSHRLSNIQLQN